MGGQLPGVSAHRGTLDGFLIEYFNARNHKLQKCPVHLVHLIRATRADAVGMSDSVIVWIHDPNLQC